MINPPEGTPTYKELFDMNGAIIDVEVHLNNLKKIYAEKYEQKTGQPSDIQPPLGDESRFDWY